MKVEAAMKGAEMIKEVPGHIMSTIQDEIDPEIVAVIERLLGAGQEKESSYKIAAIPGFHAGIGKALKGMGKTISNAWSKYQAGENGYKTFGDFAGKVWNNAGKGNLSIQKGIQNIATTAYNNPWTTGAYAGGAALGTGMIGAGLGGAYLMGRATR